MSIHSTHLNVRPVRAFADNYIWLIESPQAPSQVVAVDPGNDELLAVASDYERLSHEMSLRHPERDWVPATLPGVQCESLRAVLDSDQE